MNTGSLSRLKGQIERYWDWRSASYELDQDKSVETVQDWEFTIKGLVAHLHGSASRALDVGTGPGQLAFYLAQAGIDVTGIDISPKMVETARKKARERMLSIDFQTGDAEHLPFEANTFDVVVSRNLVWTLPAPETAMREWHRVLKPGGRIIISDGYWQNLTWSRIHHLIIKAAKGFLKTRSLISCRFFFHYANLINSLPLYEGVTYKDVGHLMRKAGFRQILSCNICEFFRDNPYGSGNCSSPSFLLRMETNDSGHFWFPVF